MTLTKNKNSVSACGDGLRPMELATVATVTGLIQQDVHCATQLKGKV